MEHQLFVWVDLLGTFAFAVSGAVAAGGRRLDLFGVVFVSYVTAVAAASSVTWPWVRCRRWAV